MIPALIARVAVAQSIDPGCAEPYTRLELGAALAQVTDALTDEDIADARSRLSEIEARMPCLDDVVDHRLFARFARHRAVASFYAPDENEALRWGIASRLADPDLAWSRRVPVGHPLRDLVGDAEDPEYSRVASGGLGPPRGGGVFLSGLLAFEPAAHEGLPLLVQVFDSERRRVDAWWQVGGAFPAQLLTRPRPVAAPPWWDGPRVAPISATQAVAAAVTAPVPVLPQQERTRSEVPVVPLVASGALAATGVVAYILASSVSATLPDQRTSRALTATRSRANALVIASGVSIAGAVGVGAGGVLLHGGGIHIRF